VKAFFQRWVVTTLAVLVATYLVKGITYDSVLALFVAALVLGILNALVRPVMLLLSLPLLIVSLGLFILVINGALLYLVGKLVAGFHVASFGAAFWGALVISVVSLVVNSLTGTGESRVEVRRRNRPSRRERDHGDGPVIDV
jgi:putative membrane protein